MSKVEKILVPVDFSRCSRSALEYAVFLAEKLGSSVVALHVWEAPYYLLPDATVYVPGREQQTLAQVAEVESGKQMAVLLRAYEGHEVPVTGRIESGEPTKQILEEGKDFDLIVMGTHGRTGLSHLFLGSVTENVVRRASCPVVTIREAKPPKAERTKEEDR